MIKKPHCTKSQMDQYHLLRRQKTLEKWKSKQFDIEGEVWIPIKGFEHKYAISSKGRFRRLGFTTKGGNINLEITHFGYGKLPKYKKVSLEISENTYKWRSIHTLVAEHFIPNHKNKPCINHIDNNKHNNAVENLEWCTYKENTLHSIKTKTFSQIGSNSHMSKINEQQAKGIFNSIGPIKNIAIRYNTNFTTVWNIKTGRAWSHVTGIRYVSKIISNA